jgi:excisionase family DNA binding protein
MSAVESVETRRKAIDRPVTVQIIDGLPAVVITDRATLTQLCALMERVNAAAIWRRTPPITSAVLFATAARAALTIIDSTPVPQTEPINARHASPSGSWVSTEQAAQLLGITSRAIRKRVVCGAIAGAKVGNRWLIDLREIHDATA